jgi:malto-oligosyltrehalose trehalohydrolase
MVLLDVVYNHFGPKGNYLSACAPGFFTDRHKTPWGAALNYDGAHSGPVREFAIQNALYWIQEFHLDGLRLDAVHAIIDDSPTHVLTELAERVRASASGREIHLLVENEENQSSLLYRDSYGRATRFNAQWNDDVHHALHTAVTHEGSGYYQDYIDDTDKLGRALAEGFAFQGELMTYRGSARGERSDYLPPSAFVAFIQNHDQVGNRAFGERIGRLTSNEALLCASAIYLLLPQIPLLFMGEEWNAPQPFLFFCDFPGPLGDSVRNGRRQEFAKFREFADEAVRERIPDPLALATFKASKLCWDDLKQQPHADYLARYRRLLDVRHREIVPILESIPLAGSYEVRGRGAVVVRWRNKLGDLTLTANLSDQTATLPAPTGRELWREGEIDDDGNHGPYSMRWAIDRTVGRDRR